jgi:hypothetical protein
MLQKEKEIGTISMVSGKHSSELVLIASLLLFGKRMLMLFRL